MSFDCNASASMSIHLEIMPPRYDHGLDPVGSEYDVQVTIIAASFICSMIGVILDIGFICRKKTNLLVRLSVYLMVATTLGLAPACLYGTFVTLSVQYCQYDYLFTGLDSVIAVYCVAVEAVIACFINVTLMINLYTYTCGWTSNTCASCWRNRMNSHLECLEAIFVTVLFSLPVLILILNETSVVYHIIFVYIVYCILAITFIQVIPYLVYNVVLLIRNCWLQRRQVARVKTSTIIKEMAFFFLLLFTTVLAWAFVFLYMLSFTLINILLLTVLSVFIGILPYLLLLYMWLSFRSSPKHVPIARDEKCNVCIYPDTTGPQTAPESTKVNLHSDPAAHSPNFLSPSGDEYTKLHH